MTVGSSTVDRLDGVNEGIAKKAPVRVASTVDITLSGLQAVDGVTVAADDRVLVKSQDDATTNGIYNASSGTWTRALDFNGNRDIVKGSEVYVNDGSTLSGTTWGVTSSDPVTIDTDNITFSQRSGGGGGSGVTSVGLVMPTAVFDVANSPITSSGNLVVTFDTQTANTVFAGPTTGAAATPAFRAMVMADLPAAAKVSTIIYVFDNGGVELDDGMKGDIPIDFACTITEVEMLADQSGSVVVDIWADSYANYPPTDVDSITASATPTISGATKYQDATLTGWTTSVAAGTTLRFNVDSCTTITRLTIALKVART